LRAFHRYRAARERNPFAAAAYRDQNPHLIARGAELASSDDEPPEAA
jgi:hypothetical protein